jgi:signal transduction histidine kinase
MIECAQLGQRWQGDMVLMRQDGSSLDIAVTLAPVRDAGGEIVAFINTVRDISRLKELDRLKSKFVSDVSHELRTPLTNFRLYLDLLTSGPPEKRESYIGTLQSETDRLVRLVEEVLDISRLDIAGLEPVREPTNLRLIAEPTVRNYQAQALARNLRLTLESVDPPPAVLADPNQIAQVVTNLVTNALNYAPAGGEITLRIDRQDGEAILSVHDTGVGIPPEDLEHLFERFYRGRSAREMGAPGSGLGLAICREIVDLHGGHIGVESRVGGGTTFTVRLPAAPPAEGG